MNYYIYENFFKRNADCAARTERSVIKDKIFLAVTARKVEDYFSNRDIKKAMNEKWLEKTYFNRGAGLEAV